jgi:hypothetical protein
MIRPPRKKIPGEQFRAIPSKGEQMVYLTSVFALLVPFRGHSFPSLPACPNSYFSLYTLCFSLASLRVKAGKGEVWAKAKDSCAAKFARTYCRSTTSEQKLHSMVVLWGFGAHPSALHHQQLISGVMRRYAVLSGSRRLIDGIKRLTRLTAVNTSPNPPFTPQSLSPPP